MAIIEKLLKIMRVNLKLSLKDVIEKIIPFFNKYPIDGLKSKDFLDLKKVALLMEQKSSFNSGRI